MKTDIQNIKNKLAKLLKLSENEAATDGEIQAALNVATQLMQKHQLTRDDIDLEDIDNPTRKVTFKQNQVFTLSKKMFAWEISLARFICNFLGSCKYYLSCETSYVRKSGIMQLGPDGEPREAKTITFYGPQDDVEAAVELYEELQQAIQTMAIVRFGKWAKGDGGAYCEGFVSGLDSARHNSKRALETGDQQTAGLMVLSEERQLALRNGASTWLTKSAGVKLSKSPGLGGASSGSGTARAEGRRDGANYDPSRPTGTRKIS